MFQSLARAAAALFVLALPAAAQSYVFKVNQAASNFTWTGTSTLGPIQGNPSNAFQFAGTTQLDLTISRSLFDLHWAGDAMFSGSSAEYRGPARAPISKK